MRLVKANNVPPLPAQRARTHTQNFHVLQSFGFIHLAVNAVHRSHARL